MASIPFSYNLKNMKVRWVSTSISLVAIALVVAVFIYMMLNLTGSQGSILSCVSGDNAIILREGSNNEERSNITLEEAKIISGNDAIEKDKNTDQPVLSVEVISNVSLLFISKNFNADVLFRGVSDNVMKIRDKVKLVKGRMFKPGLYEAVVGLQAAKNYLGLKIGDTFTHENHTWSVVGHFDARGSIFDSEIWCDPQMLKQSLGRKDTNFNFIIAKLKIPGAFSQFKDSLEKDPRLNVDIKREVEYFNELSDEYSKTTKWFLMVVIALMGSGAVFAGLTIMYASISSRSSEIATMKALGFGSHHIVLSFLLESVCIAFIGGLLGSIIVLPFDGLMNSTLSYTSRGLFFSHFSYYYDITPIIIIQGIIFSLVLGFLGGLLPALRAARQSIVNTLRRL